MKVAAKAATFYFLKVRPMNFFRDFATNESGATAIEYGLILAIISAFIIGSMAMFEDTMDAMYQKIKDGMDRT